MGYLILFLILTFVSQRQSFLDKKLSPLVFHRVSTYFITTLSIIRFILHMILSYNHSIINYYVLLLKNIIFLVNSLIEPYLKIELL